MICEGVFLCMKTQFQNIPIDLYTDINECSDGTHNCATDATC